MQIIKLDTQAERYAWLKENINLMPGSGIVYCLTIADTEKVSRWLNFNGVSAFAYNSKMEI